MWDSGEVSHLEVPGKLSHLLQVYVPSVNFTVIFIVWQNGTWMLKENLKNITNSLYM